MRAINNLSDVQIVLNQHDTALSNIASKDIDRKGLKITGAGNGTNQQDYVTLSQMQAAITTAQQSPTNPSIQHFGIVFTEDGIVTTGMQIPAYIPSPERTGLPIACKVLAIGPPSGGNLTVNFYVGTDLTTGKSLLASDIIVPPGTAMIVTSSNFINPIPYFGTNTIIYPVITNGAGASVVTMEIFVKRGNFGS
jgi:hypothetical protein